MSEGDGKREGEMGGVCVRDRETERGRKCV